jgi:hypothetical protein
VQESTEKQLWSVNSVAERWDVHPASVRRLIRLGDLRSVNIGGRRLIPASEITRAEQFGVGKQRKKVSQR